MIDKFKYKVTLIVPIYNMEKYLAPCLDSIVMQTIDKDLIEVLLINDGSTDTSPAIMHEYAEKYPFMKEFHKENEGLSMTRNYGIRKAQGQYLMYLDSDDTLSPDTLKLLVEFFDKHYDETDLVTYDEIPIIDGEYGEPHYRYTYLKEEGVYDLNEFPYVFCSQTRINVCVKNLGDDNILFDFDRTFRQEDQKYCTQVLQRKMKIGYCPGATYYYLHQPNSIVRTIFYAYYIFESSMKFWEDIFECYKGKEVPYYIQALYLNDVAWKTQSDILLPYHYSEEEFEKAKDRIQTLLDKIDDIVILGHPALDKYQKHYFISTKRNNDIRIEYDNEFVKIINHDHYVSEKDAFRIMINRFKVKSDEVEIEGILESPVLDYIEQPELLLLKTTGKAKNPVKEIVPIKTSAYSYHKAKSKTAKKYYFRTTTSINQVKNLQFAIKAGGKEYSCKYRFNYIAPFGRAEKGGKEIKTIVRHGRKFTANKKTGFKITEQNKKEEKRSIQKLRTKYIKQDTGLWLMRNKAYISSRKKIWLYCDCKGVFKDNAYYQFEHDIKMKDGIDRYYVINEEDFQNEVKKYPKAMQKKCVQFGSNKHKTLFLAAEKVITAYIERKNYNPLENEDIKKTSDLYDFPDLYYLQHGVLHAHVPWKYSVDKMLIRKEVISTRFEEQNLKTNYGFSDDQLIKSGMPRYDMIDSDATHGNRILYAPSWRKYLITQQGTEWIGNEKKFLSSIFYKESLLFLNSPELQALLEKTDAYLDFKLHPIFERYQHLYKINNPRVRITGKKIKETDYNIFITDFSSFVFDFAYLKTPIVYFMPDYELFVAGMNYYRKLDMPMTDGLGPFAQTKEELMERLSEIVSNEYQPLSLYKEREETLFFFKDNNQRDRVYKGILEE